MERRRILALALALAGLPACDRAGSPVAIVPGEILWSVPAGDLSVGPLLVSGRVLLAQPGSMTAYDPLTGARVWSVELPEGRDPPALTARGGAAYAVLGRMVAVRAADGTVLWTIPSPGEGFLAADSERLYLIRPASVVALDTGSGSVLWERPVSRPFGLAAVGGGLVCLAGGAITCYDGADGGTLWSAAAPDSAVVVDLDVGAARTVASTSARELVAYDRRTGTLVWRRRVGTPLQGALVAGLAVYACGGGPEPDDAGRCLSLAESNGEVRWTLATRGGASAPLMGEGRLIFVDGRAIVEADPATGRVLGRTAPPRPGPFHQAYLAFSGGVLYARFLGELLAVRLS